MFYEFVEESMNVRFSQPTSYTATLPLTRTMATEKNRVIESVFFSLKCLME